MRLDRCDHMTSLDIEHFFDAFCFEAKKPWRTAACQALRIPSCRITEDTHLERLNETIFSLSLGIPVERKTSTVKRDVDLDMESCQNHILDEDSGWLEVLNDSSTDSKCTDVEVSSIASNLDRFDTGYDAIRGLADGLYNIDLRRFPRGATSEDTSGVLLEGGWKKLQDLTHLPRTWPLIRLNSPARRT